MHQNWRELQWKASLERTVLWILLERVYQKVAQRLHGSWSLGAG